MIRLIEFLNGKKTYIVAGIIAVVTFLYYSGLIDKQAYDLIVGVLVSAGLTTLRAGVTKSGN